MVELLVVIAIIGVLVALLLPAVQAAREAARRVQCSNYLKQQSLAMLNHHDAMKQFPSGGWGWKWTGDPDRGTGLDQPGSWIYSVLPYIEQSHLFELGSDGDPSTVSAAQRAGAAQRDQMPLPAFYCPSRRPADPTTRNQSNPETVALNADPVMSHARSDYAGNMGIADNVRPGSWPWFPGSLAEAKTFKWPDVSQIKGIIYERSEVKIGQISDGTSNTYMIGEKYLTPDAYLDGSDFTDAESMYTGGNDDTIRITSIVPLPDTPGIREQQRFGSSHPGIWLAAFCDGSVQSMSFDIDADIHAENGTRSGEALIHKTPGTGR